MPWSNDDTEFRNVFLRVQLEMGLMDAIRQLYRDIGAEYIKNPSDQNISIAEIQRSFRIRLMDEVFNRRMEKSWHGWQLFGCNIGGKVEDSIEKLMNQYPRLSAEAFNDELWKLCYVRIDFCFGLPDPGNY